MNAPKRKAGRPVSDAMKTALALIEGGMGIEAAAAETGLTFQGVYKALKIAKNKYEWRVVVKGPDSETRTLWVTAQSVIAAAAHARMMTRYAIILIERRGRVTETRKQTARWDTTPPTPSTS